MSKTGAHKKPMIDLNQLVVEDHRNNANGGYAHSMPPAGREIASAESRDGMVKVYFEDLEERLIELIEAADVVVGCVAWLTSEPILAALATKRIVAIVVQKEDFLRPDLNPRAGWKTELRRLYGSLHCDLDRYYFDNRVGTLSSGGDPTLDAVRCAGVYNGERAAAWPRMHHKFLVMADFEMVPQGKDALGEDWERPTLRPHTVWTGSFNLTRNANFSLENAVVLRDAAIVRAYYDEWGHVESLSEPLDWEVDWAEPEWRIGT